MSYPGTPGAPSHGTPPPFSPGYTSTPTPPPANPAVPTYAAPPPVNPHFTATLPMGATVTTTFSTSTSPYPPSSPAAGHYSPSPPPPSHYSAPPSSAPYYSTPPPTHYSPTPPPASPHYSPSATPGGYPGHSSPTTSTATATISVGGLFGAVVTAVADRLATASDPFTNGNRICLKSLSSGQQLRINPGGVVDGKGAFGPYAQFDVFRTGPTTIKLRSAAMPGNWLRIDPSVGVVDGNGAGGTWTDFIVVNHGGNVYSLKSATLGESFVGIYPTGDVKPAAATGTGQHGRFIVKSVSDWSAAETMTIPAFTPPMTLNPYPFTNGNIIVLKNVASNQNLQVMRDGSVNGIGGFGKWSQFEVITSGTLVRLRSVANPSSYLRIDPSGALDGRGTGGIWTEFRVISHGGNIFSLRSNMHTSLPGGYHVGILSNGSAKAPVNTGTGNNGRFLVKSQAEWDAGL
eukprot:TRINITY_DN10652_c0_g2_i1.p1 TRINITY_DN10652_c0_g2~~TRINITY_DN10652_c0_g2_i1.p1  ORF type:complete len:472 (-),score=51.49 TRINITY_DN10652_c0_g2_i1:80-1456(-)